MKIFLNNKPNKKNTKHLYIESSNWDDYSYKSTFEIYFFRNGQYIYIGEAKIIDSDIDAGRVRFDSNIEKLPPNYCSLGQDESYYRNIKKLNRSDREEILKSLNDCAFDTHIYELFRDLDQFKSSAVRFSEAELALKFAIEVFKREPDKKIEPSHSFSYKSQIKGFESPHNLSFKFFSEDDKNIPSNINIIIGRNGTGKTQILSDLAKTISGYGFETKEELIFSRENKFSKNNPSFGRVIVISYSAFDNFEIPGKDEQEKQELVSSGHVHGYKYCGLRERIDENSYRLKDIIEISSEFTKSYKKIKNSRRSKDWNECIEHILNDPSFRGVESHNIFTNFPKLSSGQKIILSILAGVFSHIKANSLVIIDEPETHLHPSLISAFMHSLRAMLNCFDSYAIVATHSPVILQETPSMFVQVFKGNSQNPKVSKLKNECFGEEISTLTEDVFHVSYEESNFYKVLKNLSKQGFSLDEIERIFERRLGFTARSFIETL